MNQKIFPTIGIIYGPTGVGKTALAEYVALRVPVEIINMDVGQFYTPLSIGTAKPNLEVRSVRHHLFNILDEPADFSVTAYRSQVKTLITEIWARGATPLLVGGSGFYMRSLFFPPQESEGSFADTSNSQDGVSWDVLHSIDPERAAHIRPSDTYRISRALNIWYTTGQKPSQRKPMYDPIASAAILHVTRERSDLYARITERVGTMMQAGWLDEVKSIADDPAWVSFIRRKKLIGYDDFLTYVTHGGDVNGIRATIAQRTRNYAKRQETYWRMFEKEMLGVSNNSSVLQSSNLTLTSGDVDLYIKSLLIQV